MRNAWFWIHLLTFTIYSLVAFRLNLGYLYWEGDGAFMLNTVHHQAEWLPLSLGFSADFLQGLGDMSWAINTRLDLGYALPLFLFGLKNAYSTSFQIVSYTVFSIELFICTFIFARAMRVEFTPSIAASWIAPLLIMPYFGLTQLYSYTVLIPHFATGFCGVLLILAATAGLGCYPTDKKKYHDIARFAVIVIIMMYLCIIEPAFIILWAPTTLVCMLGITLGSENKKEFMSKIIWLSLVPIILTLTGCATFAYGVLSYSVAHLFPNKIVNEPMTYLEISTYFFSPVIGKILIIVSCAGMLSALFSSNQKLKYLAISALGFMALVFGVGSLIVRISAWRGPFPIYFEAEIWSIYIVFASWFIFKLIAILGNIFSGTTKKSFARLAQPAIVLLFLMSGFAFSSKTSSVQRTVPLPSTDRPIISALQQDIGLAQGALFRGRVATLLFSDHTESLSWLPMTIVSQDRLNKFKNDYYWIGLWYAAVPTLFEYNQSMSPAFFYVAQKLVAFRQDEQMRNVIVLRRPDYHNLSLLGVRYVISDRSLPLPFKLVLNDKFDGTDKLFLYELPDANIGKFSPTHLITAMSLDDAIANIDNKQFNPATSAVVYKLPTSTKLVPAANVSIAMNKGFLHVIAQSSGTSLLALPFEFSHCLTVSPSQSASIVPINAIQLGVLFTGSININIAYNYSLTNSTCRIKDGKWLSSLTNRSDKVS